MLDKSQSKSLKVLKMLKSCARCHRPFEGSNRSKYCDPCSIEVRREKKANYQRKRRFEKKLEELKKREYIKVSELPKYEGENKMCAQVRAKLEHHGSYWDWLEGKHNLTREEKYHIARCDRCQRLWAKLRSPKGLDVFHEEKPKDKDAIQSEAERDIRTDFPDLI
jgi:hypothetical protein